MAVDSRFTEDERKAINTVLLTLEAERANRGCTFPVPAIATVRAMLESPDPSRRAAVDVDAVLKLIDEFAAVSVRSIFHPEVTPQINEQFAAIWAMLEGTA